MKKVLKEILKSIEESMYFVDEAGNRIQPEEAIKNKVMIRPIDPKQEAKARLLMSGIDIDDRETVDLLYQVLNKLSYKKMSGLSVGKSGRSTYTDEDKAKLIDNYNKSGQSKAKFARENNINYQTLMSWLKE